MSQVTGDKSRFNRERRKGIARRARMRELRASLGAAAKQAETASAAKSK